MGTTGAVSVSETGAQPTSTPTTSGTTETTVTDGSDGSSGGTTVGVGSSGGSTGNSDTGSTGGSTTGTGAFCGPPCDAPWVHEGDLTIDSETDLASLRCLVEVTGTLELSQVNSSPPTELGNLRKVGLQLSIGWAHTMTSMAGLECLEFIGDTLSLPQNTMLADISALAGVKHMGSLSMWGSPLVTDLSLFDGVTGLRWIHLKGMSGVPRLPVPGPDTSLYELKLEGCDALTDLDALAGVPGDPMGIQVVLVDNPKLTSIAGLGDLWNGGAAWLFLDSLPALKSLAGLEGFEGSDNGLAILRHLPLVPDVEALAGIDVLGTLYLDDMPKLTTLAPLAGLRQVQDLTLGSCSKNNGAGLDGLTTLAPLEGLEVVGSVNIARNGSLTTLPQFTGLKFDISQVMLIDNPKLSAMQVDAFVTEHGGCAQPPMECPCFEDFDNP